VIRHYYQESQHTFVYLALELCPASLANIIENLHDNASGRGEWSLRDIVQGFDKKRAMRQVADGLRHLHRLGLVHRDIKPQNILVSSSSSLGQYRMLISDFGICKKLDVDQTSFLPTANGGTAAGTAGWRAPEILWGDVKLPTTIDGTSLATTSRLNQSVDIFALGCLYFYILTNGGHPYGDRFEREANIIKDKKDLSLLTSTEESTESQDLITRMLQRQPSQRPDTETCLLHPFFWDPSKRLGFLQDASDRFEVICKDLKDVDEVLIRLERDAESVVGSDWHEILDEMLIDDLRQYRKYDGSSVRDLLRALRNKVRLFLIFSPSRILLTFLKNIETSLPRPLRRPQTPSRSSS
jgi:serine/threonine-protein kinase/endoribonuclease IRE1